MCVCVRCVYACVRFVFCMRLRACIVFALRIMCVCVLLHEVVHEFDLVWNDCFTICLCVYVWWLLVGFVYARVWGLLLYGFVSVLSVCIMFICVRMMLVRVCLYYCCVKCCL